MLQFFNFGPIVFGWEVKQKKVKPVEIELPPTPKHLTGEEGAMFSVSCVA